jgi:hypothetical protein
MQFAGARGRDVALCDSCISLVRYCAREFVARAVTHWAGTRACQAAGSAPSTQMKRDAPSNSLPPNANGARPSTTQWSAAWHAGCKTITLFVQVIFLERLWADKLLASVDSVSLTPWDEVCSSTFPPASLPLHLMYCLLPPCFLPHAGYRLALGWIFTGAARLCSGGVLHSAQSICQRPRHVLHPLHAGQGMLGSRGTSRPQVLFPPF